MEKSPSYVPTYLLQTIGFIKKNITQIIDFQKYYFLYIDVLLFYYFIFFGYLKGAAKKVETIA